MNCRQQKVTQRVRTGAAAALGKRMREQQGMLTSSFAKGLQRGSGSAPRTVQHHK